MVSAIEDPFRINYNKGVFLVKNLRKNGHLLLVFYREEETMEEQYKVITVIETSKVNKYLQ